MKVQQMKYRYLVIVLSVGVLVASADAAETCTVVVDAASGKPLVERGDCRSRVTPASTFKIAISLMGYDSGFLKDTHQPVLPYRPDYVDWRASWKHPTDPMKWMSDSVVWYSQQVTQSLGKERFAAYVRTFDYGNMDVDGDREHDGLTLSWLNSSLRISPLEQVSFLTKLVNRRLGVSQHAYTMTEKLIEHGAVPGGWRMHGKYGSAGGWGWYVGWASKGERSLVFARLVRRDAALPKNVSTGPWTRDGFIADFPQLIGSAAH